MQNYSKGSQILFTRIEVLWEIGHKLWTISVGCLTEMYKIDNYNLLDDTQNKTILKLTKSQYNKSNKVENQVIGYLLIH